MRNRLIVFLILLIALIGCASGGITLTPSDNKKAEEILSEYIIQPGDSLQIDILENATTSKAVVVRPDGKISLPQLNDIQAAGLTALQLRENLLKEYKEFYNVIEITVAVTGLTGYKINIIGNVRRPGLIILNDKTTFLEALSLAGGLGDWANPKKIYIMRSLGDNMIKIKVNYKNILKGEEKDIWILPGDMIVVP
ncbi:MAG: polysaccharide biosynthesis/export family protein [bacterium]